MITVSFFVGGHETPTGNDRPNIDDVTDRLKNYEIDHNLASLISFTVTRHHRSGDWKVNAIYNQ